MGKKNLQGKTNNDHAKGKKVLLLVMLTVQNYEKNMECLEVWRKMSIFAVKMLILQRFCRKEDFRSEKKHNRAESRFTPPAVRTNAARR